MYFFFFFLLAQCFAAQSNHISERTSSSEATTPCQQADTDPESVALQSLKEQSDGGEQKGKEGGG